MASGQKVQGLNIKLSADITAVNEALKDVNKSISSTSKELKEVDKLLKFNPTNTTLLAQKQGLLADAIDKTKQKLEQLQEVKELADRDNSVDKNSKEYRELERQIENTKSQLRDYERQLKGVNNATDELDDNTKDATNELNIFGESLKANILGDAIVKGFELLCDGIRKASDELAKLSNNYRELEVFEAQFENNVRNTTDATYGEIKALKNLASQKSRQGVISKKSILSAYQELATYVESTDAIKGLTDVLLDMSAQQYGVDATAESVRNIATTLGKALANGDYSGLTRLGYGFTDAQERIMKYGDELQRVEVINDVISDSIGGMNEKLAETDAGKIYQLKGALEETKEEIGEIWSNVQVDLLEEITPLIVEILDDAKLFLEEHKDELIEMVKSVIDWITSDDTREFFKEVFECIGNLGDIIVKCTELADELGILDGILQSIKGWLDAINTLVDAIRWDLIGKKNASSIEGAYQKNGTWYIPAGASSLGFGALRSGGFMSGGNQITLNATFNNNGSLDEASANRYANIIAQQINEQLGQMI